MMIRTVKCYPIVSKVLLVVAAGIFFLAIPRVDAAERPKWISNICSKQIAPGETYEETVSATGSSNLKIECTNCTSGGAVVTDHGNGTATVTWETISSSFPKDIYGIKIRVTDMDNDDTSTNSIDGIVFIDLVDKVEGAPQFSSSFCQKEVTVGDTISENISATGGSDTVISCLNCNKAKLVSYENGTALLSWDTAEQSPSSDWQYVQIEAKSKSDSNKKIIRNWPFLFNAAAVSAGECKCRVGTASTLTLISELNTQESCNDAHGGMSLPSGKSVSECQWQWESTSPAAGSTLKKPTSIYTVDAGDYRRPEDYNGPLPDCAFDGSCRNVNELLRLAIKGGEIALGFVGTFALAFFVYGGFMMIISMGNAERVKKGRDILVAAVVGIIITFSAYALINFVLEALQISEGFRLVN